MPAPATITAADVPASVNATIPASLRIGIAYAYNAAVAAAYTALDPASQATFTPPTVGAYIIARMTDVFSSYTKQAFDDDLAATQIPAKWSALTQAQRDAIKATLATV